MVTAIVFLPLLGALLAGFLRHQIGAKGAQIITCLLMIITAILSWIVFFKILNGS